MRQDRAARMTRADTVIVCSLPLAMHSPTIVLWWHENREIAYERILVWTTEGAYEVFGSMYR